ncbi:MAG: hypothetical protein JXJ17_08710 [Anaerolineae bacterium]|nr:hypothetical protein [Anaerolineae bacterium]
MSQTLLSQVHWILKRTLQRLLTPRQYQLFELWRLKKRVQIDDKECFKQLSAEVVDEIKKTQEFSQKHLTGSIPTKRDAYRTYVGGDIGHTWMEMFTFELLLTHTSMERIIELGTWRGHFSTYLATWSYLNKMEFITVEKYAEVISPRALKLLNRMHATVIIEDIFSPWLIQKIGSIIQKPGITLLICDNGNKPRELALYAPYLKTGDLVMVDDWGTEALPEVVKPITEELNLIPYFEAVMELAPTGQRCFIRQ